MGPGRNDGAVLSLADGSRIAGCFAQPEASVPQKLEPVLPEHDAHRLVGSAHHRPAAQTPGAIDEPILSEILFQVRRLRPPYLLQADDVQRILADKCLHRTPPHPPRLPAELVVIVRTVVVQETDVEASHQQLVRPGLAIARPGDQSQQRQYNEDSFHTFKYSP